MKIDAIEAGTDILVTVRGGEKHIEFLTTALDREDPDYAELLPVVSAKYGNGATLPVELICADDKRPLSFMTQGLMYQIVAVVDAKPYKWLGVVIPCIKTKSGKLIHVITAVTDGAVTDRRDEYRVYVGTDGILSLTGKDTGISALIKDVSMMGIGVVASADADIGMDSIVRAKFELKVKNRTHKLNGGMMHFDLLGKIVRCKPLDNDRVLYGVHLMSQNNALTRYINVRQSEQIENERSYRELQKALLGEMKAYDDRKNRS